MAVIAEIFDATAELVITTGTPTTEAKAEIKTQPVKVECKISKCSMAVFKM